MKAVVNDRFEFELSRNPDFEVLKRDGNRYEISHKGQKLTIEVLKSDVRTKWVELAIDGHVFRIRLSDSLDASILLTLQKGDTVSGNQIVSAPIPGVIKELYKEEGDSVLSGEPVLVLEAMKMENTIQSTGTGEEISFQVQTGDRVTKGQPLFSFTSTS